MENSALPDSITHSAYLLTSLTVFVYEFIGTFALVGAINCSKGDAACCSITLFFMLLVLGPITGGHMNPAVTLGVFVNKCRERYRDNQLYSCVLQMIIMMGGQILGAIASMYIFFTLLSHTNKHDGSVKQDDFPTLKVHTQNWQQAFGIEAFSTFIFIGSILLVKDSVSSKYASHIGGAGINFLGCGLIALVLAGMILMAGPHSSASLNPAVSISQTVLVLGPLKNRVADTQFWHVYMMGPFAGAAFAGFASWAHSAALEAFGPDAEKPRDPDARGKGKADMESGDKQGESKPLLKKEDETK